MSGVEGQRILVTGGTGSIGSEVVRQLLKRQPKHVTILSRDDSKQFYLKEELSNHNNVRRSLIKDGQNFNSENDTEVAAGYISNQISKGKGLETTLKNSLKDLDGFYTFIAGTKDGFALLRDEIACKPAVVAETKDYVAVASEFQAMAHLPNVNSAKIFEPKPGVVYHW